jgi:hypothetical protein
MCRVCSLIGGLVVAVTLAGCGESAPEGGTVPFKASAPNPTIDGLTKQMSEQAKKGIPANKKEEASQPAADSKPADAKPADSTLKTEEKKKD